MFAYWLHMNMRTHGFDLLLLKYNVNNFTMSIWDSLPRNTKSKIIINSITEDILGSFH